MLGIAPCRRLGLGAAPDWAAPLRSTLQGQLCSVVTLPSGERRTVGRAVLVRGGEVGPLVAGLQIARLGAEGNVGEPTVAAALAVRLGRRGAIARARGAIVAHGSGQLGKDAHDVRFTAVHGSDSGRLGADSPRLIYLRPFYPPTLSLSHFSSRTFDPTQTHPNTYLSAHGTR